MEVVIKGNPDEIAVLVLQLRGQPVPSTENFSIGFPCVDSPYTYAYNLIAKHDDVPERSKGSE